MRIVFILLTLFYANTVFASCDFNQQYERVALVIGNSDYDYILSLENPINDAKNIAQVLRDYNFSVIERHNQSKVQMQQAISCFGKTISEGGVGLLFYAGHGVQVGEDNYLIPSDFEIDENERNGENQVRDHAVSTNNIMGIFELVKTSTNIVILDACRDNPFKSKKRSLKASNLQRELTQLAKNGLAEMAAPVGSYIAFATSPGDTSSDGLGKNGLFTEKLLRYIKDPSLDINSVFDKTAADVYKSSNKDQIPWRRSSLLSKFYFSPFGGSSSGSNVIIRNAPVSPSFEKYFNKGKMYLYEKSRPEKAIVFLKQSLKYSKGNSEVHYHLGYAYLKLTNYAEAITQLKKTVKLNPEKRDAYQLLSKSYAGIGDREAAVRFKQQALKLK